MYTDLLTRIKNAQAVKREGLKVPFSRMDMAIADILVKKGYLKSAAKKGRLPHRAIDIKLQYENDQGAINGVELISRPSRRIYTGYRDLRPVKHGYGLAVISTSKGIMPAGQARKNKLGGQLLFKIW